MIHVDTIGPGNAFLTIWCKFVILLQPSQNTAFPQLSEKSLLLVQKCELIHQEVSLFGASELIRLLNTLTLNKIDPLNTLELIRLELSLFGDELSLFGDELSLFGDVLRLFGDAAIR